MIGEKIPTNLSDAEYLEIPIRHLILNGEIVVTVKELSDNLSLEILTTCDEIDRPVTGGYCSDLLSWVMGRASEGDAWITVMGNINSIAVAVLADISCIILADSSALDEEAKNRAEQQNVIILRSELDQFTLCNKIGELLGV
ncbi:MAG: DRTGG domain-containing protein [Oscillospiraceae bacterium]|nr:DRTGG domain-containing protein [Oscillospiraceae bacterium]